MRLLNETYYYEYLDEEKKLLVHISSLNELGFKTRLVSLPPNNGSVWMLQVFECDCNNHKPKPCDDCPDGEEEHSHELGRSTTDGECDHVFDIGHAWVTCVHCGATWPKDMN